MALKKKTGDIVIKKMARWERRVFNVLFLTVYLLVLAWFLWPTSLSDKPGWPDAVLLVLAVAATIASLARHLPLQNILSAACFIALVGGTAEWIAWKTGIPFGAFTPGDNSGPKLFGAVSWAMPVVWVLAILNSRGIARLVLRPWRRLRAYGFWMIGVTTVLTLLFELALEPFASKVNHYWFWEPSKSSLTWQGVPLMNFFGWLVVTLLIMTFITPMLINKHPAHRRPPDFHPLAVWLGGIFLFGVGAATAGLWSAVLLDGFIGLAVAAAAVRGARW